MQLSCKQHTVVLRLYVVRDTIFLHRLIFNVYFSFFILISFSLEIVVFLSFFTYAYLFFLSFYISFALPCLCLWLCVYLCVWSFYETIGLVLNLLDGYGGVLLGKFLLTFTDKNVKKLGPRSLTPGEQRKCSRQYETYIFVAPLQRSLKDEYFTHWQQKYLRIHWATCVVSYSIINESIAF